MKCGIFVIPICVLASLVAGMQPDFDHRNRVQKVDIDQDEFLLDTTIGCVFAPNKQEDPAVAFDGTNYLVVWTDWRSGSSADIFATRVTQTGVVLDIVGITVAAAARSQTQPAVAFDGTNYLVVWSDGRSGNSDIYGARVTPAGVVLDSAGIPISTAENNQTDPAVAFDGTNYLVVWSDSRSGNSDIYGARVTPAGVVLDSAGIPISTAANFQGYPAVAFSGTNYFVAWHDNRRGTWSDVYGARVAPDGTVLDPSGISISAAANTQAHPAVAFDGTNFMVVWHDDRRGYLDIYGARVSQSGTVLDGNGLQICTATRPQSFPALVFDSTNYLVVWADERNGNYDIYATRVTPGGTVIDTGGIPISTVVNNQRLPAVGFDGSNYLVVWTDGRSGVDDIFGTRVGTAGTVIDSAGFCVSTAANTQGEPASAFDGSNYLVVWTDDRNGSYDIFGIRVTPAGTVIDSATIPISTAENNQNNPAVAFDGTNYLVVWGDRRNGNADIYGTRVTPEGVVVDTAGMPISEALNNQVYPAVAFDGTNYLVVWADDRNGDYDIYGARVSPQGTVLDTDGIAISTIVREQSYPAITFDGTNYLVVWADKRGVSGYADIYGARVHPTGTVLDPVGIPISTAPYEQSYPAVAFDGANFFVVWQDQRVGAGYFPDIYGARVSQIGSVIDTAGIPIATDGNYQGSPVVAFDGVNSLVLWEDRRSGYDIYGAWVAPDGMVFDSGPIVFQEGGQFSPAIGKGSGREMLLVYQGWTGMVDSVVYNTQRIWGKINPFLGSGEYSQHFTDSPSRSASIVRRTLECKVADAKVKMVLLDASGRRVMELKPGANDVSQLAGGVYFVRFLSGAEPKTSSMSKVVIQR
ncbi:MAG: hypothetical protein ABIK23_01530 [candidate division WOR-3 bacterium]